MNDMVSAHSYKLQGLQQVSPGDMRGRGSPSGYAEDADVSRPENQMRQQ